jgi:CheY-like chemotaxis protein
MSWLSPREPSWLSIDDLDRAIRVRRTQRNMLALREIVPIIVIDDQPFEPGNNLRSNHYNISQLQDLQNVTEVDLHPIVLCDLQGVGAKLHTDLQGAHLIREIKKHFPEKVIIAYTAISKNTNMSKIAQANADLFLKKDAPLEDWIDALDGAIQNVTDPVYMWKKFRKRLLDTGMTPYQLTKLENAFVSGAQSGNTKDVQTSVMTIIDRLGIHHDLRAIIQGFVASLIFKWLVG